MPPIPALFTLAIGPGSNIICTQPSPKIYLLTFKSPPDNRMLPAFCKNLLLALDILEHRYPKGVVVTTSSITKFYSNGLDYESAIKTERFFEDNLYPLWRRLLTYVHNKLAFDPSVLTFPLKLSYAYHCPDQWPRFCGRLDDGDAP